MASQFWQGHNPSVTIRVPITPLATAFIIINSTLSKFLCIQSGQASPQYLSLFGLPLYYNFRKISVVYAGPCTISLTEFHLDQSQICLSVIKKILLQQEAQTAEKSNWGRGGD